MTDKDSIWRRDPNKITPSDSRRAKLENRAENKHPKVRLDLNASYKTASVAPVEIKIPTGKDLKGEESVWRRDPNEITPSDSRRAKLEKMLKQTTLKP